MPQPRAASRTCTAQPCGEREHLRDTRHTAGSREHGAQVVSVATQQLVAATAPSTLEEIRAPTTRHAGETYPCVGRAEFPPHGRVACLAQVLCVAQHHDRGVVWARLAHTPVADPAFAVRALPSRTRRRVGSVTSLRTPRAHAHWRGQHRSLVRWARAVRGVEFCNQNGATWRTSGSRARVQRSNQIDGQFAARNTTLRSGLKLNVI